MDRNRKLYRALLWLYGLVMLWLLFDRELPDGTLPYLQQIRSQINLQPLKTLRLFWNLLDHPRFWKTAVVNLLGNVVMFLPLGALLPLAFPRLGRWWKVLPLGALLIAGVEIAQALTLRGSCDVDDLILNLLGVWLGYLVTIPLRNTEQEAGI